MNIDQLSIAIAVALEIPFWEAESRVAFNVSELELDPNNISDEGIAEVQRCIAADIRAGK
jgi:hypothetical protein